MSSESQYDNLEPGSDELVTRLVEENHGWATSIAKSVARAWNLDWQLDGLDGGAYEALLFCARRYDPARGVPFRGYARRRIHEASTQEARDSKSWQRGTGAGNAAEQESREISSRLFDVFPELRDGLLPSSAEETGGAFTARTSVRQLLAGASMVAAFENAGAENPAIALEYKELITLLSSLEPVHQEIVFAVYYKGQSMRNLAEEWKIDDLSVIREHKVVLEFLCNRLENPNSRKTNVKIRRGLRGIAQEMRRSSNEGPFTRFLVAALILLAFSFGAIFSYASNPVYALSQLALKIYGVLSW